MNYEQADAEVDADLIMYFEYLLLEAESELTIRLLEQTLKELNAKK